MPEGPWSKAIHLAKSQQKLAVMLGVKQQTISYYAGRGGPIPVKYWRQMERVVGLPRHEQRPDDWAQQWPELDIDQLPPCASSSA